MISVWIQWLKSHHWYALTGLFGLLCVYAIPREIIPQIVEISDMRNAIAENETRLAQVEEWDWTIRHMEKKKDKLHKQIENLVFSQQQKNQFSNIYAFLSENAGSRAVTLINIKLGESEPGDCYVRLPIALRLRGTYHDLAKYINALETSEPIIQIASWSVEAKDMTEADLTARMVIRVYFLT